MSSATPQYQEFFDQLLAHMGIIDAKVEIDQKDDAVAVTVKVSEEDSGMMIGRYGETVLALQRIGVLSFHQELEGKRLIVSVNDYAEKRMLALETLAHRTADRVKESGSPMSLPPLPASERRTIHMILKDDVGVVTHSEGEGKQRILIVSPASMVQQ